MRSLALAEEGAGALLLFVRQPADAGDETSGASRAAAVRVAVDAQQIGLVHGELLITGIFRTVPPW